MPPNHLHPDAYHAYHYGRAAPRPAPDAELEAWLHQALGAKEPDPAPVLHDL